MSRQVTLALLGEMKRSGQKIVSVVAWDYQIALIADRAGVEIVSVGDSVGLHLWGHRSQLEVTMDQMVLVCQAVRRGVRTALVSADLPFGPVQQGPDAAVSAAIRLAKEAGADMVKIDGAADFPEAVSAVVRAGIPVWAQFGITPQTALRADMAGVTGPASVGPARDGLVPAERADALVAAAVRLQQAGVSLLDFTGSGPVAGPAVVRAVSIPVLGGLGGGPWLDGRIRMAHAAIGYAAAALDDAAPRYANVAQVAIDAISEYARDVRGGRPIRNDRVAGRGPDAPQPRQEGAP
jgi:3-methyl-2-oxobutanoate hydroxymethyltransferase